MVMMIPHPDNDIHQLQGQLNDGNNNCELEPKLVEDEEYEITTMVATLAVVRSTTAAFVAVAERSHYLTH